MQSSLFRGRVIVGMFLTGSGMQRFSSPYASQCSATDEAKKVVGYRSIDDYVKSGMVVGLGTGSTAKFAVDRLGQKLKSGELKNIIAIPTSEATRAQAMSLNIPLATLNEYSEIDITIDGADQVDVHYNLIKGGGGALLREKMVEMASKQFVVIVDETKLVPNLGPGFPLPVEITPFCYEHTIRCIKALPSLRGCRPVIRRGTISNHHPDGPDLAITDNGNYIVDLHFDLPIMDASQANRELQGIVGVVEHGLFIDMSSVVLVAKSTGCVDKLIPRRK